MTGAAFYYDYTDKQVLGRTVIPPLGTFVALVNVPKSAIKGVEAQATYTGVPGLALTVATTYLDTVVTSTFNNYSLLGAPANFQGQPFPYTPKWQVVFDGEYRFPVDSDHTLFFGTNVNYRSKTTAGFGSEPLIAIANYTLLDLRAGVEFGNGHWRGELFGENVTNTYYWTNVIRVADAVSRFAGAPPFYGVRLSYRY